MPFHLRTVCLVIFIVTVISTALPIDHDLILDDLDASASGYGKHGRVQIKVYRGPSKGYGYHKFAPWGYWVKQPEDDHAKHHHDHHDDHH